MLHTSLLFFSFFYSTNPPVLENLVVLELKTIEFCLQFYFIFFPSMPHLRIDLRNSVLHPLPRPLILISCIISVSFRFILESPCPRPFILESEIRSSKTSCGLIKTRFFYTKTHPPLHYFRPQNRSTRPNYLVNIISFIDIRLCVSPPLGNSNWVMQQLRNCWH